MGNKIKRKVTLYIADDCRSGVVEHAQKLLDESGRKQCKFDWKGIKVVGHLVNTGICQDCDKDAEYFVVVDTVWKAAGFETQAGVVCMSCIEKRLGRKLVKDDFRDCVVNRALLRMMK